MRRTRITSLILFGLILTTWAVLASGPPDGTASLVPAGTLVRNHPDMRPQWRPSPFHSIDSIGRGALVTRVTGKGLDRISAPPEGGPLGRTAR